MKKIRTILALSLILFVVLPSISFATEGYSQADIKIKKRIINQKSEAAIPEPEFEFELVPDSNIGQGETFNGINLYSGTNDLLILPVSKLQFSSQSGLEQELNLELRSDLNSYLPGIYRYSLTEREYIRENDIEEYDGIEYDDTEYIIDVYVTNDDNGSKQATIIAYKSSVNEADVEDGKVSELLFESLYKTYKLTVIKKIVGNAANLDETFTLDLELVNNNHGYYPNETYLLKRLINGNPSGETITVKSNEPFSIDVNSTIGLSFEIHGLSPVDFWVVRENDSKGYISTGNESLGEIGGTNTFGDHDKTVIITNELNGVIPTGVVDNVGIYVIFTLVIATFAFIYIRSGKKTRV